MSALVRALVGDSVLPPTIRGDVRMCVGKHTVTRITTTIGPAAKFTAMTPLRVEVGGRDSRAVLGYVDRSENDGGATNKPMLSLWGVGASAVMKGGTYRTYHTRNLHGVLAEIAYDNGMVPDVVRLPRVYTALVQHGSTWEFINEQAERAGLWLWCDGLRLRTREPLTALREGAANAIPFSMLSRTGVKQIVSASAAAEVVPGLGNPFVGRVGFAMDDAGRTVAARVAPKPLSSRSVLTAPPFERVARNGATSRAGIESDLSNMGSGSLLPYTLHATLAGDVDVVPLSVIALEHPAPNVRGNWLVHSVNHRLDHDATYFMDVVARRASPVDDIPTAALAGRTRRSSRPSGRVVSGRWRP